MLLLKPLVYFHIIRSGSSNNKRLFFERSIVATAQTILKSTNQYQTNGTTDFSSTTMKPKDLTLYHFAGSSSFASNVVLAWTGQEANVIRPDESYPDHINPANAVPSLILPNGSILTQNLAITNYIAKKADREDLIGGIDFTDQAQVLKWCSYLASDVHSSFWAVYFSSRYTTNSNPDSIADVRAAGLNLVRKKLNIIESHMKDRMFLVTDHKTVADAHLYSIVRWVVNRFPDLVPDFPNLIDFADRMSNDEGVLVAMQYEDKEKYGR